MPVARQGIMFCYMNLVSANYKIYIDQGVTLLATVSIGLSLKLILNGQISPGETFRSVTGDALSYLGCR